MTTLEGQMNPEERNVIKQTVIDKKPDVVFEIGTWKGGGSTLAIASALATNKKGMLHTCETEKPFYDQAIASFNEYFPDYLPFVTFYNESSDILMEKLIKDSKIPDIIMQDGISARQSEDSKNLSRLELFLKDGAILIYHDSKIQPIFHGYVQSNMNWKNIHAVDSSMGLIVCEFKRT